MTYRTARRMTSALLAASGTPTSTSSPPLQPALLVFGPSDCGKSELVYTLMSSGETPGSVWPSQSAKRSDDLIVTRTSKVATEPIRLFVDPVNFLTIGECCDFDSSNGGSNDSTTIQLLLATKKQFTHLILVIPWHSASVDLQARLEMFRAIFGAFALSRTWLI